MEIDAPKEAPDRTLEKIGKEDLYEMSAGDLEERIASLKAEVKRCEAAMEARADTKSIAEKFFNN